jgi:phosphonate transport system substrate-binding protein
MARKDIPQDLVDKVAQLLFSLHTRPEGQEILARMPLSKFEKADHQTYQVIRDFIQTFSTTIRPITSH